TYDDVQQVRIYFDGVEVDSDTANAPTGFASQVSIGSYYNGSNISYFDGAIDEFQIYNRALSAQQIAQLFADGTAEVGGPRIISAAETLENEIWDLYAAPVSTAGNVGVAAHSANTVTITSASTISVQLENGATSLPDDQDLDAGVTG